MNLLYEGAGITLWIDNELGRIEPGEGVTPEET